MEALCISAYWRAARTNLLVAMVAAPGLALRAQISVMAPPFIIGGSIGSGNGEFGGLMEGVGIGTNGNIYLADPGNHRIQEFMANGTFVTFWGSLGTNTNQFGHPDGVAIDQSNNVFVVDIDNNRVDKFTGDGTPLTQWGSLGSGTNQFSSPRDLAVDRAGNVYVVDEGNNRIQKFTGNGNFLRSWGAAGAAAGEFNSPRGIAVDNAGNVYVGDQGNFRVQKLSSQGTFLLEWGSAGTNDGQFGGSSRGPSGLAVDEAGNVCVADGGNNRIQVFTGTGVFLGKFGSLGTNAGQFNFPTRLAFDPTGTLLYSTETTNNRCQAFSYTVPPPMILSVAPAGSSATVAWSAIANQTYQLQFKTNLNQPSWSNSASAIIPTNYPAVGVDERGSDPQRFYRVELLP
jgi:DNA-binding beta-propeller fold protein YncE